MSTPPPVPAVAKPLDVLRGRLIRAIFAISEKSHTATRSILDGYGRHVNPSAAPQGLSMLPHNPRPHPRNAERTSNTTPPAVMLSLVGIAVAGYYDAVLHDDAEQRESYVKTLDGRITFLEQVAKWRKWRVVGGDAVGYTIEEVAETPDEAARRRKDEK